MKMLRPPVLRRVGVPMAAAAAVAAIGLGAGAPPTFALQAVTRCEDGWQFYDDGNAYQCTPSSSAGASGAGGAGGAAGGDGRGGSSAGANGGSGTYSAAEFASRASNWPSYDATGTVILKAPGPIDLASPIRMFSVWETPDGPGRYRYLRASALDILNAWYRDLYVLGRTARPGEGGRTRYCGVSGYGAPDQSGARRVSIRCSPLTSGMRPYCAGDGGRVRAQPGQEREVGPGACTVDAVSYVLAGQPEHGVARARDGKVYYEPENGYGGPDTVRIAGVNSQGAVSDPVEVPVDVNRRPSCQAPVAPADADRGQASRVALDCSDPDGDPVSLSIDALGAHGLVRPGAGAALAYVSDRAYLGPDEVAVRAVDRDGLAAAQATVVRLNVREPAPECEGFRQDWDGALDGGVTVHLGCGLPGGVPRLGRMEYRLLSQPSRGTVTDFDPQAGTFTYTPALPSQRGVDPVRFAATYAGRASNEATAALCGQR